MTWFHGVCRCCQSDECVECGYCSGCAELDRPGCPTSVCCTPHKITAVISGVNVCSCVPRTDGFGGFLGAAKLIDPPSIDGTYILTQSSTSPCRWSFFKSIASTIEYYLTSDCTGSPAGSQTFDVIEIVVVRSSPTLWAFQIGDGCQTFFGGDGFDCIGSSTTLAATENNCKVIGTFTNEITSCCAGGLSLCGQWATGGSATLEACA